MTDIEKYLDNPVEIDEQIDESCGMGGNHATEADFDKIRDGLDSDENLDAGSGAPAASDANNGIVPHVVGSPDESDALPTPGTENKATSPAVPTTPVAKSQSKRTPKAKSSAAVTVSSKQANKAASVKSAAAQKRRISSHQTPTGGSAKRGRRAASGDVDRYGSPSGDYDGASSSSLATRTRIEADAFLGTLTKRAPNAIALLDRPVVTRPETQIIDMNSRSNTLADRDIVPSDQTFGFLGLGIMGSTIVKDLIYTGHKVVVWNRTIDKVHRNYNYLN